MVNPPVKDQPVDLLILNAKIVTLDPNDMVLLDGALAISGNSILEVAETNTLQQRYTGKRTIDAGGKVVMPGIVNVHTHIAAPVFRGYIEEIAGALYHVAFPVEELLTFDDIYTLSLLGCIEVLRYGTTCVNDIFHHSLATAKAVEKVGIRAVLAQKVFDIHLAKIGREGYLHVPQEGEARMEANIQLIEQWHGKAGGRITCRIGTHATDTCTPELLQLGRKLATQHKVGLHIHVAQSMLEVSRVLEIFGQPDPIQYLRDLDYLGADVIAVHCTFASDEGIRILAETGTNYAMCPSGYLRRGGVLPVNKMQTAGVNIGIGTDWIRMDPWEATRAAIGMSAMVSSGERDQPLNAPKAFRMATLGSAKALGFEQDIGSLEVGKKADLIIVDTHKPHLTPVYDDNLLKEMVFHVNGTDIETVIVDGRILMEENVIHSVDEPQILQEAQRVCEKIRRQAKKKLSL